MCGIAFVINYGKQQMDVDFLYEMFESLSARGTDSSGYYFERIEEKRIAKRTIKAPLDSSELITQIKSYEEGDEYYRYKLTGKEDFIMFHCRQKTRGTEYDNKNNMPIFSKNYILIHNGVISSSKIEKYEYKAEVDSEEILARVETMGVVKGIDDCHGSMAIALKPIKNKGLYIYRNTNPMELVYFNKTDVMIGCSNSLYVLDGIDEENIMAELKNPDKAIIQVPSSHIFYISLTKPSIKSIADLSIKVAKKETTPVADYEGYSG